MGRRDCSRPATKTRYAGSHDAPALRAPAGPMIGLLVLMLAVLNVGGLISLILDLGAGHWGRVLSSLTLLVALNLLGFWLLRSMREDG
jgi:hypothetical protein